MFLNEEVGSLKKELQNFVANSHDESLGTRVSQVIAVLEDMKTKDVDVGMVETVLKIQQLKEEIIENGSES